MTLPPEFDEPAGRTVRREIARLDAGFDAGQRRLFRVLWFMVPPGSVVWNMQFQALLASRFLSDVALQALLYSVLIDRARSGGGAVDAALVGAAFLLPGVVLGMYGGAVADALPKRAALVGAYLAMGVLAFLIPGLLGTGLLPLLLVLFAVRVAYQVSQPSEASTLPLVATEDELASATSFLSFASSAGEVVGKALLAPVVVVLWGVRPVTAIAGLLFLLSATRVLALQVGGRPAPEVQRPAAQEPQPRGSTRDEVERYARAGQTLLLRMHSATREMLPWLAQQPAVLWTLLLAAMASTVSVTVGILGPQYTGEVLDVDPENALYVFTPAAFGLVIALVIAPLSIRMLGERVSATVGFVAAAAGMTALGRVNALTDAFGWLVFFDIPGVPKEVEVAAILSISLGFGLTLAAASTQTYVSKYVPPAIQGRTFALLGVLKDGLAIAALLLLGVVSDAVGTATVLTVAPVLLVALAWGIAWLASRFREPARIEVPGVGG
ncbi:MAG: MFS transporter [Chloroflexi bacterium]|nr:MFS transporter [Chloroflexota bacterium]